MMEEKKLKAVTEWQNPPLASLYPIVYIYVIVM